VGNWHQPWRNVVFDGETYHWSKHREFRKFLDLPVRARQEFELALTGHTEAERRTLERHGWKVRDALSFGRDTAAYRDYIGTSRGEFTVAKDQNVRFRTGWFSDRSATYLATGRPVITQDTGFGNVLPTGAGLFAFSTTEGILSALERIEADHERSRRAALDIGREWFSHEAVLGHLLEEVGISVPRGPRNIGAFPLSLDLTTVSRRPTRLREDTVREVLDTPPLHSRARRLPLPSREPSHGANHPAASIVVVTFNNLVFTRLCLETLLANTDYAPFEVIVVDNASTDGTADYLCGLSEATPAVRVLVNDRNRGFAPAVNQGVSVATGDVLVLLNNDTMVGPGWLKGLVRHLRDPQVGLVGPVTNRIGNEAQIDVSYRTYGDFLRFAAERERAEPDGLMDLRMLAMFCVAMRRDVFERVGLLDERYEVGMLEDEDYAVRVRATGHRVVCAEDVFVHHFGQATFGDLVSTGEYRQIHEANRARFEEKWGTTWRPYRHRDTDDYHALVDAVRQEVDARVPHHATVLVMSKGDETLVKLNGRAAWHFPALEDGAYAGYYPADSREALRQLVDLQARGAQYLVVPKTAEWWLEHYRRFGEYLEQQCRVIPSDMAACRIYALGTVTGG
jgi:GT2 family glycosyltransferase